MEERKFVWKSKGDQWRKENPSQTYMYKCYEGEAEFIQPKKKQIKYVSPLKERSSFKAFTPKVPSVEAGIYVIVCEKEKHAYVGQSLNMAIRLRSHKLALTTRKNNSNVTYVKMKEHCGTHGIEAFEFKLYKPLPLASLKTLLENERKVMAEMVKSGYNLYNISVNADMLGETISCPKELQNLLVDLISKVKGSEGNTKELISFVNQLTSNQLEYIATV